MNDQELEEAIAAQPFEKVTKESIGARIVGVEYVRIGEAVTVCSIALENGFSVRGESVCVDPGNYKEDIGQQLAYNNAFQKLWEFEGYLLAERRYQNSKPTLEAA